MFPRSNLPDSAPLPYTRQPFTSSRAPRTTREPNGRRRFRRMRLWSFTTWHRQQNSDDTSRKEISLGQTHLIVFDNILQMFCTSLRCASLAVNGILRRFGMIHQGLIVEHLGAFLSNLAKEEERNKYLISWIGYFLVSNGLDKQLSFKPDFKDIITRSILKNRGLLFKDCKEFKLFVGCKKIGKKISMLEHLDVFNAPESN